MPITKPSYFEVALVPYDFFRDKIDNDSESDEDFKQESGKVQTEAIIFNIEINKKTTVLDIKRKILEKFSRIGERQILPENLLLTQSRYCEVQASYDDNYLVDDID